MNCFFFKLIKSIKILIKEFKTLYKKLNYKTMNNYENNSINKENNKINSQNNDLKLKKEKDYNKVIYNSSSLLNPKFLNTNNYIKEKLKRNYIFNKIKILINIINKYWNNTKTFIKYGIILIICTSVFITIIGIITNIKNMKAKGIQIKEISFNSNENNNIIKLRLKLEGIKGNVMSLGNSNIYIINKKDDKILIFLNSNEIIKFSSENEINININIKIREDICISNIIEIIKSEDYYLKLMISIIPKFYFFNPKICLYFNLSSIDNKLFKYNKKLKAPFLINPTILKKVLMGELIMFNEKIKEEENLLWIDLIKFNHHLIPEIKESGEKCIIKIHGTFINISIISINIKNLFFLIKLSNILNKTICIRISDFILSKGYIDQLTISIINSEITLYELLIDVINQKYNIKDIKLLNYSFNLIPDLKKNINENLLPEINEKNSKKGNEIEFISLEIQEITFSKIKTIIIISENTKYNEILNDFNNNNENNYSSIKICEIEGKEIARCNFNFQSKDNYIIINFEINNIIWDKLILNLINKIPIIITSINEKDNWKLFYSLKTEKFYSSSSSSQLFEEEFKFSINNKNLKPSVIQELLPFKINIDSIIKYESDSKIKFQNEIYFECISNKNVFFNKELIIKFTKPVKLEFINTFYKATLNLIPQNIIKKSKNLFSFSNKSNKEKGGLIFNIEFDFNERFFNFNKNEISFYNLLNFSIDLNGSEYFINCLDFNLGINNSAINFENYNQIIIKESFIKNRINIILNSIIKNNNLINLNIYLNNELSFIISNTNIDNNSIEIKIPNIINFYSNDEGLGFNNLIIEIIFNEYLILPSNFIITTKSKNKIILQIIKILLNEQIYNNNNNNNNKKKDLNIFKNKIIKYCSEKIKYFHEKLNKIKQEQLTKNPIINLEFDFNQNILKCNFICKGNKNTDRKILQNEMLEVLNQDIFKIYCLNSENKNNIKDLWAVFNNIFKIPAINLNCNLNSFSINLLLKTKDNKKESIECLTFNLPKNFNTTDFYENFLINLKINFKNILTILNNEIQNNTLIFFELIINNENQLIPLKIFSINLNECLDIISLLKDSSFKIINNKINKYNFNLLIKKNEEINSIGINLFFLLINKLRKIIGCKKDLIINFSTIGKEIEMNLLIYYLNNKKEFYEINFEIKTYFYKLIYKTFEILSINSIEKITKNELQTIKLKYEQENEKYFEKKNKDKKESNFIKKFNNKLFELKNKEIIEFPILLSIFKRIKSNNNNITFLSNIYLFFKFNTPQIGIIINMEKLSINLYSKEKEYNYFHGNLGFSIIFDKNEDNLIKILTLIIYSNNLEKPQSFELIKDSLMRSFLEDFDKFIFQLTLYYKQYFEKNSKLKNEFYSFSIQFFKNYYEKLQPFIEGC